MRSLRPWAVLVVGLGLLALVAACGGGGGTPRACGGGCGDHARCLAGACVENLPPVAVLALPEHAEALDLVELDGSSSSDPDAALGDRAALFRWTVTSLDQACVAPAVTGTDFRARVRFACSGSFRVNLVVSDLQGEESAPESADLTVSPHTGTPAVVASADQVLNHACSGTPLGCTTAGALPVVSASIPAGVATAGTVRYHWSADPTHGIPLDQHRRVTFSPSPDVAMPSVHVEVDATAVQAIVDDWVLRVSASDEAGPLGEATTRLSIANRPPVLSAAAASVSVDHAYSGGTYRATADASRWQDPDGDPLTLQGSTGNTVCASVSFRADGTAAIECSRAFEGTPALDGFAATHEVNIQPRDPWAPAAAASTTAVTIRNRAVTAADSTEHGYHSCEEGSFCCFEEPGGSGCAAYQNVCSSQSATLHPTLADPDGDPLTVAWTGTGFTAQTVVCEPASCTGTTKVPAYRGCGTPPSGSSVGGFTASDGLTSASGTLTFTY